MKIRELLQEMVDQNASDIFIVAGLPLTYQVEGRQVRWDAPLMPADTSEVVHAIYGLAGRDINPFLKTLFEDYKKETTSLLYFLKRSNLFYTGYPSFFTKEITF